MAATAGSTFDYSSLLPSNKIDPNAFNANALDFSSNINPATFGSNQMNFRNVAQTPAIGNTSDLLGTGFTNDKTKTSGPQTGLTSAQMWGAGLQAAGIGIDGIFAGLNYNLANKSINNEQKNYEQQYENQAKLTNLQLKNQFIRSGNRTGMTEAEFMKSYGVDATV